MSVRTLLASLAVVVLAPLAGWAGDNNDANGENACDDLVANCVCAESYNTAVLNDLDADQKDPANSTSKQCSTNSTATGAVETSIDQCVGAACFAGMAIRTDAAMLAALPAGSSVTHAVGTAGDFRENTTVFFMGNKAGASFVKRLAARFYVYHSNNFQFATEGTCTNAKFLQLTRDHNHVVDYSYGWMHVYNYNTPGWNPNLNCCIRGPVPIGSTNVSPSFWRGPSGGNGIWVRAEYIITNRAGPGYREELWVKDMTTPGANEIKVIDTGVPNTTNFPNDPPTSFPYQNPPIPPTRMDEIMASLYGEDCNGYKAISYYIMAGWDTDEGQRIPPSAEFEGTGGGGASLTASLVASSRSGPVGSMDLTDFTTTVTAAGTGPDYVVTLNCNANIDTSMEDTVLINDDATPGPVTHSDKCAAIYSSVGNYTASVTVKDCANTGAATCTPVATTTAYAFVNVTDNSSICPVGAQSGLVGARLWDASGSGASTVLEPEGNAGFKSGDTIPSANRACVTVEALGNPYLAGAGGPGSVKFELDGTFLNCESGWQYATPADNSEDNFDCAPSTGTNLGTVGAHTLVLTPYDTDGCQSGVITGTPLTIIFDTVGP